MKTFFTWTCLWLFTWSAWGAFTPSTNTAKLGEPNSFNASNFFNKGLVARHAVVTNRLPVAPPIRFVFEGDSLTGGSTGGEAAWPIWFMANYFFDTSLYSSTNFATNSKPTINMVADISRASTFKPAGGTNGVYCLYAGTTDLMSSNSPTTLLNISNCLFHARSNGFVTVGFTLSDWDATWTEAYREYRQGVVALNTWIRSTPLCDYVVDVANSMPRDYQNTLDGLHFTTNYQNAVAGLVTSTLERPKHSGVGPDVVAFTSLRRNRNEIQNDPSYTVNFDLSYEETILRVQDYDALTLVEGRTSELGSNSTKTTTLTLYNGGNAATLTFPESWVFVNSAAPATLGAGKWARLQLSQVKETATNVFAEYRLQDLSASGIALEDATNAAKSAIVLTNGSNITITTNDDGARVIYTITGEAGGTGIDYQTNINIFDKTNTFTNTLYVIRGVQIDTNLVTTAKLYLNGDAVMTANLWLDNLTQGGSTATNSFAAATNQFNGMVNMDTNLFVRGEASVEILNVGTMTLTNALSPTNGGTGTNMLVSDKLLVGNGNGPVTFLGVGSGLSTSGGNLIATGTSGTNFDGQITTNIHRVLTHDAAYTGLSNVFIDLSIGNKWRLNATNNFFLHFTNVVDGVDGHVIIVQDTQGASNAVHDSFILDYVNVLTNTTISFATNANAVDKLDFTTYSTNVFVSLETNWQERKWVVAETDTNEGAAAWTPETPTNTLVQWLKADALSLNDNDPVTNWTASAGLNATNWTATEAPTNIANGQNSLPVVRFDGVNDKLYTADWASSNAQPYTLVISFKFPGADGEKDFLANNDTGVSTFYSQGGNFIFYAGSAPNMGATNYAWNILVLTLDGASSTYQWGTNAAVTFNPGANGLTGLCLGADPAPAASANIDMGEIIIWKEKLNATDLEALLTYMDRWGYK